MMTLLDTALSAGMKADYVLFDSWFSNPAQVTDIHSKGMNVIAMIKKSSRIKYSYCGEQLNIKEIFGECHSLSYDALTAHVAIVFTRYMLLAMEQRQNEDQRTLGELFFFLVDEMADITFSRSLAILMAALMAILQEILKLSDEQLTAFTADFEARLPEYLRNALHPEIATNMNIMNIILEAVNIPKYFPLRFLFSFAIYLKLIRLAMDAIRVPRPPILVPTIKAR